MLQANERRIKPIINTDVRYGDIVNRLESSRHAHINLGLATTIELLDRLGNPHHGLRGVLVAGTNGKGSVCATLDSIARSAGHSTVLMVKPHLIDWTERIVVDGSPINQTEFARLAETAFAAAATMPVDRQPTTFEILTATGFLAAALHSVRSLICEVGLGGRLDSTNVVDLGVAVITNISLDHVDMLGTTIEQIAAEKAAIIKPGNTVVTAATEPAHAVIANQARKVNATVTALKEGRDWTGIELGREGIEVTVAGTDGRPLRLRSPLTGHFQCENVAVACHAARQMSFDDDAIVAGAAATQWGARLQWIDGAPAMLVDGAHNPAALRAVAQALPATAGDRPVVAVFGAMADKQLSDMLIELAAITRTVVFTRVELDRATPPHQLREAFGTGEVRDNVAAALERGSELAGPGGVVLVCGSLALAGSALGVLTR